MRKLAMLKMNMFDIFDDIFQILQRSFDFLFYLITFTNYSHLIILL